jgi:hypothetical protein
MPPQTTGRRPERPTSIKQPRHTSAAQSARRLAGRREGMRPAGVAPWGAKGLTENKAVNSILRSLWLFGLYCFTSNVKDGFTSSVLRRPLDRHDFETAGRRTVGGPV